ncbi:ADP-ribosylglycohydrolase family protein [Mesorhizobium sp. AR07]|uniref:ADP-ribosylglycohydrolase family protein n=1 Tax=Mesorhizobium sp. AR07 TaxID=2865838 RepID=UPI00215ECF02|nr:ADP-ribosylglycohydrolase family protein [Mesorhizobium sp. AR07]UVK43640.1 ADP-ribosylglycohydrolase family protein [Mesorhizobium sp. AR07]
MPEKINNPLRVDEVSAARGLIGITFAPGKRGPSAYGGVHERDLGADLDEVAQWGAAAVVTLIEEHEFHELQIEQLGEEVRRRHMEWHHLPIVDVSVPDAFFEKKWPGNSAKLRGLLKRGNRVLIHCRGGIGRAGMISARLLVELGADSLDALATVRKARHPNAAETKAQEMWVTAGKMVDDSLPSSDIQATRDRAAGALLGLAVGDAVGAAIEFTRKPEFTLIEDMIGGGPHPLEPGQWTDDTAMALALAESLKEDPALDAGDLMDRFVDWWLNGTYSCTGTCFDIGITTRGALDRYRRIGDPYAGSEDSRKSGNGALMRLSPVAIRHWRDLEMALDIADRQTRTTHGSPQTIQASRLFTRLLVQAIEGHPLTDILTDPEAEEVDGGFRNQHRNAINGSGYVVKSLQAALWAVNRTTDFRSAVLLAANLGDDADTTAAIAGQLAGAAYGASGIPRDWLERLAWRGRIEVSATGLFDASLG